MKNKFEILSKLKERAGNHSPSRKEITLELGYDPVEILSNPYATDLIYQKQFITKIQENFYNLIESYPPNQKFLLGLLEKFEPIDPDSTIILNGAQQAIELLLLNLDYKNALLPILVTLFGIATDARLVQERNA